jgi:tetratricopeptide (TPR) repeat protein
MPWRSFTFTIALLVSWVCGSSATAKDRILDRIFDRDLEESQPDSPPQAVETRSQAESAYQRGDYPRVIELTTWLIGNYPEDHAYIAYHIRASAKVELGRATSSPKQVRDGISDARQGLAQAGAEYPWLHIPYLYGLISLAEIERRPEHADMAIQVVSPVLKFPVSKGFTDDDRANLFYQRGLAYAAKGDFKMAAADQSEALRLAPGHLGAHVKRAEALAGLGDSKAALAAYDEAVERFPDNLLVYNDRGNLRRKSGDLDGAIGDFSRCLAIDPKFAVGYLNRGFCLIEQDHPLAAAGDFSEALKLKLGPGQNVLAYRLRASARVAQGDAAAGVADLTQAIKVSPQEAVLYEERGFANFFVKNDSAASADFAKALQLNPQSTHLVPWQALVQARAGQTAQARAGLENALAAPTPPAEWTARLCRFLLDQASEQDLLEASAESSPREKTRHSCEAHYFAGQKQLLHDEAKNAAGHFREAIATREHTLSAYRGARYELKDFK